MPGDARGCQGLALVIELVVAKLLHPLLPRELGGAFLPCELGGAFLPCELGGAFPDGESMRAFGGTLQALGPPGPVVGPEAHLALHRSWIGVTLL